MKEIARVKDQYLSLTTIKALLSESGVDKHSSARWDEFNLRPAAVMILLVAVEEDWHLLYIRRSEFLKEHKGQVAFPGGRVDGDDPSPQAAALRETYEEIGVPESEIILLGSMHDIITPSGYCIHPVVGTMSYPYLFLPSPQEVVNIFTIPLEWLADPAHFLMKDVVLYDRVIRNVIYFQPYHGELLWGISGLITLKFLKILNLLDLEID